MLRRRRWIALAGLLLSGRGALAGDPALPEDVALSLRQLGRGEFEAAEALLQRRWQSREASDRVALRGLIGARSTWLPDRAEPEGFGLLSYLLLESPARDAAEEQRHRKAIEAHLRLLPALAELERYQRRSLTHLTLLPIKRVLELPEENDPGYAEAARLVLRHYDHARAKAVLAGLGRVDAFGGPFIASRLPAGGAAPGQLFFDLRHVAPELVWDWTRAHAWLAAEQRSWSAAALQTLSLQLRNLVAAAARQGAALAEPLEPARRVELGAGR